MQEIYRVIGRMTQTDLTVTIIGESGTGKELVARALHEYGNGGGDLSWPSTWRRSRASYRIGAVRP